MFGKTCLCLVLSRFVEIVFLNTIWNQLLAIIFKHWWSFFNWWISFRLFHLMNLAIILLLKFTLQLFLNLEFRNYFVQFFIFLFLYTWDANRYLVLLVLNFTFVLLVLGLSFYCLMLKKLRLSTNLYIFCIFLTADTTKIRVNPIEWFQSKIIP